MNDLNFCKLSISWFFQPIKSVYLRNSLNTTIKHKRQKLLSSFPWIFFSWAPLHFYSFGQNFFFFLSNWPNDINLSPCCFFFPLRNKSRSHIFARKSTNLCQTFRWLETLSFDMFHRHKELTIVSCRNNALQAKLFLIWKQM